MRRPRWPVWAGLAALLGAVLVAVVVVGIVTRPSESRLLWSENFTGPAGAAPDPAVWSYQTGQPGRRAGQLQCYTKSRANSGLDGHGDLVITARHDVGYDCAGRTTDYTSARLATEGSRTLTYGHLRVRALLPSAPGTWTAIWALGSDVRTAGWPKSGEIDVCETIGSQPGTVRGTVHGPGIDDRAYSISGTGTQSLNRFHVYGIDWTRDQIDFDIDGDVYQTISRDRVQQRGSWVFDQPFYVLLSFAIGGWPGPPTAQTDFPQRMIVDYVRAYN